MAKPKPVDWSQVRMSFSDYVFTERHKKSIARVRLGKLHTEEAKVKCGDARRGKPLLESTKAKVSATLKGHGFSEETIAKLEKITREDYVGLACPHCSLVGDSAVMFRWHFYRCKWNPNLETDRKRPYEKNVTRTFKRVRK